MGQCWSETQEVVAYVPIRHCDYNEKYYFEKKLCTKDHLKVKNWNSPPSYVDEFIHDGREIMCIASILELGLMNFDTYDNSVKKYVRHAITTNPCYNKIYMPDPWLNWEREDYMKFLFQMHADTYHISLGAAIDKWLPKFESVYNGTFHAHALYMVRKLKNKVDSSEWNAKFV